MIENEDKKEKLQDISGYSELSNDDKVILESAVNIIAVCESCIKDE